VLFFDPTGAGQLTQANQVIFADWDPSATSDMRALLDVFDTNHDDALDAGDTNSAKFFVTDADLELFGRLTAGTSCFNKADDSHSQLTRIRSTHRSIPRASMR